MESVKCSLCDRTFGDTTLLSLHHEYEPCFNSNSSSSLSSSSKATFICPICDEIFYDPLVLQIHVNEDHDHTSVHTTASSSDKLYAQELERRERMKLQYEQQQQTASAISYEELQDEDAQIARLLQEEENAQSFEEFQVRISNKKNLFRILLSSFFLSRIDMVEVQENLVNELYGI